MPSDHILDQLETYLSQALGKGWRIGRSRRGITARWRWLSVSLKHRANDKSETPWRARLRNGFPRKTVAEHWKADPMDALTDAVAHARAVRSFTEGRLGLISNPSKGWLAHRVWESVRPSGENQI